jgi:predicted amidohydrolase YtcJ
MAATSTAAGQIGMAGQLGTLESGKLADLTILEKDPYAVDPRRADEHQREPDLGRRAEDVR